MKLSVVKFACAFALAGAFGAPAPASAQTAPTLGDVPHLLKTKEAKKAWDEQMNGAPAPDGFGTRLPAGLSAQIVTAMLRPADNHDSVALVGARTWPENPDRYLAIVCTGGDVSIDPKQPACAALVDSDKQPLRVYLGLIAMTAGGQPRLVAASGALDGRVDWSGDNGLPAAPQAASDAKDGLLSVQGWDGFDLAPYRISAGEIAFGLRTTWNEGYSGGMGAFGALCLFRVDGDRLRMIFAAPMSSMQNLAGDWNSDGTRQHSVTDAANVLVTTRQAHHGYFDLLIRSKTTHWSRLMRWAPEQGLYRAAK